MESHDVDLVISPAGDAAVTPYIHPPLDPNEFTRVLLLHPSADRDSPLSCDLIHCDADDFSCEAISYAWGPPDFTSSLFCGPNKERIAITPSLESALCAFRLTSETRRLWADAVCINQQDLEEKTIQVRRMSDIYRQAEQVLVWLGDAADDSGEVINLIKQYESELVWFGSKFDENREYFVMLSASDQKDFAGMSFHKTPERIRSAFARPGLLDATRRLFSRSWFERRWVIQEVGLAQKATIQCGDVCMDARRFIACADLLDYIYRDNSITSYTVAANLTGLRNLYIDQTKDAKPRGLMRLMARFHAAKCSDDRDRVYALMGISSSSRTSSFMSDKAQHGFPALGYHSGVDHVYWALVAHTLDTMEDQLHLTLNAAGMFPSRDVPNSKVPWWVADWRAARRGRATQLHGGLIKFKTSPPKPHWRLIDDNFLCVQGWRHSAITEQAPGPRLPPELRTPDHILCQTIQEWSKFYGGTSWRKFLDCATRKGLEYINGDPDYVNELVFSVPAASGRESLSGPSTRHGEFIDSFYCDALWRMLRRRSLFRDDTGEVVNCPDDAEVGDLVVLLAGSYVPYVIRPFHDPQYPGSNSFRFIGDAYVANVMGKTLEVTELGEPQWFTLT